LKLGGGVTRGGGDVEKRPNATVANRTGNFHDEDSDQSKKTKPDHKKKVRQMMRGKKYWKGMGGVTWKVVGPKKKKGPWGIRSRPLKKGDLEI